MSKTGLAKREAKSYSDYLVCFYFAFQIKQDNAMLICNFGPSQLHSSVSNQMFCTVTSDQTLHSVFKNTKCHMQFHCIKHQAHHYMFSFN